VTPDAGGLPMPVLPPLDRPWSILVTGVGGTGIITVGALLGMAAHTEGKGITVLDQMGMAQKGGSVASHIRLAADPQRLHGLRVASADADLLIGGDLVVAAGKDVLAALRQGHTRVVLNTHEMPTADFVLDTDTRLPAARLRRQVVDAAGAENVHLVEATALATSLLGDAIATNLFLLGFAWQKGLIPLELDSLFGAIEMNGTAVEANKAAFTWGRCAAADPARVANAAGIVTEPKQAPGLDEIIATRAEHLALYQSRRYARRYLRIVERVRETEGRMFSGAASLTEAVARSLHRLMAYKDEYEVARLYSAPAFRQSLAAQFENPQRLEFHLAPPLLAKRDPATGHLLKRSYGPWMLNAFRVLARLKPLRGTALDPFARSEERRAERQLIVDYEALVEEILSGLTPANLATAVALASVPEQIRGFGHVKERAMRAAATEQARLLERFRAGGEKLAAD
jgi:indolepyruvate ferredoxin oxidoreductase